MFSRWIFSENSTKRFFAQPRGNMGTQKMLGVMGRHILESKFKVMRVKVNRKGQKPLKKTALHLKSTLAGSSTFNRAYPGMFSTASPRKSAGITKPSSNLLFVQPDTDKKFLEESTKVEKNTIFWQFSAKNPWEKFAQVQTWIITQHCTHCLNCFSNQVTCITLTHAECAKLQIKQFFFGKFSVKTLWTIRKKSTTTEYN